MTEVELSGIVTSFKIWLYVPSMSCLKRIIRHIFFKMMEIQKNILKMWSETFLMRYNPSDHERIFSD